MDYDVDEINWERWIFKKLGANLVFWEWYFVDETGDEYGPFNSKKEAIDGLQDYCFWLENGLTKYQAQMAHGV